MLVSEEYEKVAYIGLRNPDGSYQVSVPLYIKLSDLAEKGYSGTNREELIHRVSSIMIEKYKKQIGEFIQQKQAEKAKNIARKNINKEEDYE